MKTNMSIERRIISLLIALTFTLLAGAQPMSVSSSGSFYDKYPYIQFLEGNDSIDLSDEYFYDKCAKVVFIVNRYSLPQNDKTLAELEKEVLPHINKDSLELVAFVIRGAASPEGPYQNNKMLSENRAKALTDFVTSRLTFNALSNKKNLIQDCDVEDYRSLCIAMKKAKDPDYDYVKGICDKYMAENNVARLKSTLKNARQGQLWRRLLKTYFPQLRSARIMLFFRKYRPVELKPEPIVEIPIPTDTVAFVIPTTPKIQKEVIPVDTVVYVEEPQKVEEIIPRLKLLSVKTNLLLDFAYMPGYNRWCPIPNVAVEYYPLRGHFSFGGSFDMPWWQHYDEHKFFQARNYQLEGRFYLKAAAGSNYPVYESVTAHYNKNAYTGFYLQAYTHATIFGICFDANRGWVGEGVGAGVGAGYVMPLTKRGHWKLELGLQLGFFVCKYDPYQYENPVNPAYHDNLYYYKWTQKAEYFKKRQYRWNWIGPTRLGVTLSYDLLYRRVLNKGVSLINKERRVYVY